MLFVFIYEHWYLTRFPYQMVFVSFSTNTTDSHPVLVGFMLLDIWFSV